MTTNRGMVRLLARWGARPLRHSRAVWALLIILDLLPWPWGEDIAAGLFMIAGLARPGRRRAALTWADATGAVQRWRRAAEACAFLGHWLAQTRALGFRSPEQFRQTLAIEGAAQLDMPGAAILLGFHLGPIGGDLPFRVLGYPVTFLGSTDRAATVGWWSDAWQPFLAPRALSLPVASPDLWPAVLYRVRRMLLDGEKVYLMAEGHGTEVFRLPLSVGECPFAPDGSRSIDSPALACCRSSIISTGAGTSSRSTHRCLRSIQIFRGTSKAGVTG